MNSKSILLRRFFQADLRCTCPVLADRARAAFADDEVEPCPVHDADVIATRAAEEKAAAHMAEADLIADALGMRRPSEPDPPPGDPLLAALARRVGAPTPAVGPQIGLNSPALTEALTVVFGAGTANPRTPIDAPD